MRTKCWAILLWLSFGCSTIQAVTWEDMFHNVEAAYRAKQYASVASTGLLGSEDPSQKLKWKLVDYVVRSRLELKDILGANSALSPYERTPEGRSHFQALRQELHRRGPVEARRAVEFASVELSAKRLSTHDALWTAQRAQAMEEAARFSDARLDSAIQALRAQANARARVEAEEMKRAKE